MNGLADHLDELAKAGCTSYDAMRTELGQYTASGQVPPVYADIADALHATSQKFHRVNATLTEKLRHDAAALLKTVQRHGDIQRETADKFNNLETTGTIA